MHFSSIDAITPERLPDSLPLRFVQTSSRSAVVGLTAAVALSFLVLSAPVALVITAAFEQPDIASAIAEHPWACARLLFAFALGLALAGYALHRLIRTVGASRVVTIEHGMVTVDDRWLAGRMRWHQRLDSYYGLSHGIRASLSGSRHEIVLKHQDPGCDVVLAITPKLDPMRTLHLQQLLEMPEIRAAEVSPVRQSGVAFPAATGRRLTPQAA